MPPREPLLGVVLQRRLGWVDFNETAQTTWTDETRYASLQKRRFDETLLAWWALSRCTRAVVAPIDSSFSYTAAIVGGVPLVRCCSSLAGSRAAGRVAKRLSVKHAAELQLQNKLAMQWVHEKSKRGFCAITESNNQGECSPASQGSAKGSLQLPINVSTSWQLAAGWCEEQCRRCSACRFVSLSRRFSDCSWFAQCNLSKLLTAVPSFRTMQVRQ
mmetsp:Transcript_53319/g.88552  ORF Transcript_53319/g.88552 Transcript_53319/m.88552 type:complete len:216 (+) Transcript_53319:51-698(+)